MNGQNGNGRNGGGHSNSTGNSAARIGPRTATTMGMGMMVDQQRHQQQLFLATGRPSNSGSSIPSQSPHPIPSSPHSDSAALIRRSSQANNSSSGLGQSATRRPLSVPPQMMDHNYQRGGGGGQNQTMDSQNSSNTDFFSTAMNRRAPLSQQPQQTIAEEEMDEAGMEMDNSKAIKEEPEVVTLDESEEASASLIGGMASANKMPPSIGDGGGEMSAGESNNSPAAFHLQQQHSVLTMNPASAQPCSTDASESQSPSKAAIRLEEEGGIQQKTAQQREEEQKREQQIRQKRREPIVLDWRAMERAMLPQNADEPSPLEHFLLGQSLLSRLQPFFELAEKEARHRERGRLNLPIKELQWAQGAISVKFASYPMPFGSSASTTEQQQQYAPPPPQFHQCQIHFQLIVCPKQFRLIAKLEYHDKEGGSMNCPAESDVRTFERFFSEEVVRMNNEMAVFAFITLSRLSSPPIYASLAQLMRAQMEPPSLYAWRIEFELLHLTEAQQSPPQAAGKGGQQPQKNVQISIQLTDQYKQFLLIIYLRPNNQKIGGNPIGPPGKGQQMTAERRRVILRYVVQSNELNYFHHPNQQLSEMDHRIAGIIKSQTELVKQQNAEKAQPQQECCIWPCIRALLEGQHQQNQ